MRQADTNYDALPDVVKRMYTREQYAWLSDQQKQAIVDEATTPDPDSEDPAP